MVGVGSFSVDRHGDRAIVLSVFFCVKKGNGAVFGLYCAMSNICNGDVITESLLSAISTLEAAGL